MAIREISGEERDGLPLKRGKASRVRQAIMKLKPGGILRIDWEDYPYQRGPRFIIYRIHRRTSMRFQWSRIADRGGWVVERMG